MIDKSSRQHYAIQGGGPNYLGKQKMVKAPKKWKSSPDHPDTELAYITEPEKQVLIALNLHGGLEDGKPNRGPSGIISLQGDMGGWSGGSGSSGSDGRNGGGGGRQEYSAQQYTAPKPKPTPKKESKPTPVYKDPDPVTETVPGDETFEPVEKYSPNIGPSLHGGPTYDQDKVNLINLIKDQALEKLDVIPDDTTQLDLNKFGETVTPVKPDLRTQKEKDEDLERSIDWDKVKKLSDQGYNFEEIKDAMNKGLLTKVDPRSMKTGLLDRGIRSIRNIMPETGLQRSLLNSLTKNVFAPTTETMFDPKKMAFNLARNYGMKKLGLGAAVPWLGLLSFIPQLFGKTGYRDMFAKKPVDMSAFNKLGLYADRYPTATDTLTAKVPETTAKKIATGEVDLNKLITGKSDISPEFQHLVKPAAAIKSDFLKQQPFYKEPLDFHQAPKYNITHYSLGDTKNQQLYKELRSDKMTKGKLLENLQKGKYDSLPEKITNQLKEHVLENIDFGDTFQKNWSTGTVKPTFKGNILDIDPSKLEDDAAKKYLEVAKGGFIDKPLMGRSRDI